MGSSTTLIADTSSACSISNVVSLSVLAPITDSNSRIPWRRMGPCGEKVTKLASGIGALRRRSASCPRHGCFSSQKCFTLVGITGCFRVLQDAMCCNVLLRASGGLRRSDFLDFSTERIIRGIPNQRIHQLLYITRIVFSQMKFRIRCALRSLFL